MELRAVIAGLLKPCLSKGVLLPLLLASPGHENLDPAELQRICQRPACPWHAHGAGKKHISFSPCFWLCASADLSLHKWSDFSLSSRWPGSCLYLLLPGRWRQTLANPLQSHPNVLPRCGQPSSWLDFTRPEAIV